MLNQNALTPLYEQLKNAIKDDIHAQIYRPGDRMPSEAELEEKYQVSRITVRRAVKELCDSGPEAGKRDICTEYRSAESDRPAGRIS